MTNEWCKIVAAISQVLDKQVGLVDK